jgi:hypothetical protein
MSGNMRVGFSPKCGQIGSNFLINKTPQILGYKIEGQINPPKSRAIRKMRLLCPILHAPPKVNPS